MANILSKEICDQITALRNSPEHQNAAKDGWCSEGADDCCLSIFNYKSDNENDTGYLVVSYLEEEPVIVGNHLEGVTLQELMPFVCKECEIARLAYKDDIEYYKKLYSNHSTKTESKTMDKCTIDVSYETSVLIVISKEPNADNKYLFFEYMPIDPFEEPIVEKQLISPEMRDKFMELYEQYENGDNTEICEFVGSGLWSDNSETLYQCDGYKDICAALSSDPQFLSFMKEYVCQEYDFKSTLEEYINERLAAHNDVSYALSAAEQLGYSDLAYSTRQMLKGKNSQIGRE